MRDAPDRTGTDSPVRLMCPTRRQCYSASPVVFELKRMKIIVQFSELAFDMRLYSRIVQTAVPQIIEYARRLRDASTEKTESTRKRQLSNARCACETCPELWSPPKSIKKLLGGRAKKSARKQHCRTRHSNATARQSAAKAGSEGLTVSALTGYQ